jgi:perosamine synthetase
MFDKIVDFIRQYYDQPEGFIPLHEPRFIGNERAYVLDAIDSTFVSSVGKYVDRFEEMIKNYTGAQYAIATTNGTTALHMSLLLAGVKSNELVITQPLTFISTCNAISYLAAQPLFVDIDSHTLGLSPSRLDHFLKEKTFLKGKECFHRESGKRIAACVPMHTFGHPAEIDSLMEVCARYKIPLIEDAAESLGSTFKKQHTGTFGLLGVYSFNGNKTITCGGGGMIVTNNEKLGKLAKHLTTQAKVPHPWKFVHDSIGYNYRLPNLNAALACAQMEQLDSFVSKKRELAETYRKFFTNTAITFVTEPDNTSANFWLNAILLSNKNERDAFLAFTNDRKIMTRPAWDLMPNLEMFKNCITEDITNARYVEERLVNIPSSVKISGI